MITLEEFIENLTDDERLVIITDYEQFSACGVIADEPLRQQTQTYIDMVGIPNSNIMLTMVLVASAAHRYYALKYIEEHL